MALLELKDITKTFYMPTYDLTVLNGISFEVDAGEFVSIIGQSGCGKSTLMKIIGCLDIPTTGTYTVDKVNTADMTPNELAHVRNQKIGFVFQQFYLLPDLTAKENVALPGLYGGKSEAEANARAKELLERIGLADRIDYYPYQLSGGQQQRVAIARALENKPDIVLADEPTGNLDTKTSDQIVDIFIELNKKQNMTVIVVTHDIELARRADRIITLVDGKVVEDKKT